MHISIFKTYHDDIVIFHFVYFWKSFVLFKVRIHSACRNSISNNKQNEFRYWTTKWNLELYRHMNITSCLLILYISFYHFYNWINKPIIFFIFVYVCVCWHHNHSTLTSFSSDRAWRGTGRGGVGAGRGTLMEEKRGVWGKAGRYKEP